VICNAVKNEADAKDRRREEKIEVLTPTALQLFFIRSFAASGETSEGGGAPRPAKNKFCAAPPLDPAVLQA